MAQTPADIWEKDEWEKILYLRRRCSVLGSVGNHVNHSAAGKTASTIDAAHELFFFLHLLLSPHPGLQPQWPSLWHPPSLSLPPPSSFSIVCAVSSLPPMMPAATAEEVAFPLPSLGTIDACPPSSEDREESWVTCLNDLALVTNTSFRERRNTEVLLEMKQRENSTMHII